MSERYTVSFDGGEMVRTPISDTQIQEAAITHHGVSPDHIDSKNEGGGQVQEEQTARRRSFDVRAMARGAATGANGHDSGIEGQSVLARFMNDDSSESVDGEYRRKAEYGLTRKERLYMKAGKCALLLAASFSVATGSVYTSTALHLGRAPGPIEFTRGVADMTAKTLTDDTQYNVGESND